MSIRWAVIPTVALATLLTGPACAPIPSMMSDAKQFEGGQYFYSTLSKKKGKTVERLVPPDGVVTRYPVGKSKAVYVIRDAAVATEIGRFAFQPLNKATLRIELRRVSDMNGAGVEGDNGQVRVQKSVERRFESGNLGTAFSLLQAFADNPWDAARTNTEAEWTAVADETQVDSIEVGFVLEVEIDLSTGNTLDAAQQVQLYHLTSRSTYRRATDKKL